MNSLVRMRGVSTHSNTLGARHRSNKLQAAPSTLLGRGALSAGAADSTLAKGGNITGDGTLVSAGGTFTLGFFPLGPATNQRYYLGIWFSVSGTGSDDAAICWVANRERPLRDKSGVLVVDDTGSLVLRDGSGQIAWSSNTITISSSATVQLLENGNLVVRDDQGGGGMVLWQSFDHPSNTLLSGMKVGKNSWNGAEWHITSWRSVDDPSPGQYRLVLDTSGGLPDLVLMKGKSPACRAGPWNGRFFSGIPDVQGYADLVTLGVTISADEVSYRYTSRPGSKLTRSVVNEAGVVTRFVWNSGTGRWDIKFDAPKGVCDHYGHCGSFGLCDPAAEMSPCGCLRGFSSGCPAPSSSSSSTTDGCPRRNVQLQCSNEGTTDGFVAVKGVKLPDTRNATVDMGIDMEECESRCRANCSCLAYAAADIRWGGSTPSGCVMWTDNIIDLRLQGQQDLYLRLAKSELDSMNFHLADVVAPVASIVVAALAIFLLMIWWKRKRSIHPTSTGPRTITHPTVNTVQPSIPLAPVKSGTRNFSTRNVIGEGAFSIVYEGKLPKGYQLPHGLAGRTIAVKRLKPIGDLPEAKVSYFTRETEVMTRLRQHPNVLRLLAYCEEANERVLVYEYMHRRSLDVYIFGRPKKRVMLNWQLRLQIIKGIAEGVKHLHQGEEPVGSVIHRDLKPANVLLDGEWQAKIADFGTAKQLPAGATGTQTLIGTPGYMAPEYVQSEGGETTLKCDVFSFGVTLLETLSGRKNWDRERPSLVSEAWRLWVDRSVTALLDSAVTPASAELFTQLRRCIQVGLLCIQENPDERPDMSTVVDMLSSSSTELVHPMVPLVMNNGALAKLLEANVPSPTVHEEAIDFT